jgi:hypothetical protein
MKSRKQAAGSKQQSIDPTPGTDGVSRRTFDREGWCAGDGIAGEA